MIENLNTIFDVGELEEGKLSIISVLDLVVDDHGEAGKKVDGGQTTKTNEGLLTNRGPWRVADAKKDGLGDVSIVMLMLILRLMDWEKKRDVRDHPSCSWGEGR